VEATDRTNDKKEQQNRIFMYNSCLGMTLASRNWESSPHSYLSKQDLYDYIIENWAGGTPGTLLKQEIKLLAYNLERKKVSLS